MAIRKPQPVAEHEARGETARVYHEIRQTLRVSGVNLNFRTWAAFPRFFRVMWATMQPVAASRSFEAASDDVRARGADLVLALPALDVRPPLGESQRQQLQRALALYHYINPKLLLFTVLVRRGLTGEPSPGGAVRPEQLATTVPFGPPPDMTPMEMVDEQPDDTRLRRLFDDMRQTLGLSSINSDYRTLALWPDYLEPAWAALKPVVRTGPYEDAATALAQYAARVADRFQPPLSLNRLVVSARAENADALIEVTRRFERLLPGLIVNIGLFARDWWPGHRLRESPFPLGTIARREDRP